MTDPLAGIDDDPQARDDIRFLRDTLVPPRAQRTPEFHRHRAERVVALTRGRLTAEHARSARQTHAAERRNTVSILLRRRRVLAVSGATLAAAAVGLVGVVALQQPGPVYAATPPPLEINAGPAAPAPAPSAAATGAAASADPRLEELAGIAEGSAPATVTQPVEHLVIDAWHLHTSVDDRGASSAVIPSEQQLWRAGEGRARTSERILPPEVPAAGDRKAGKDGGPPQQSGQVRVEDFPGNFPAAFAGRPPKDPERLAAWLSRTDSSDSAVLTGALDLLRERVLTGPERAALLRALARHTALSFAGTTTDRAGRAGLAFTAESRSGGGLHRDVLVVAARDGAVLAHEEILLDGAAALDVRLPAVTGYRTFRQADFIATIP